MREKELTYKQEEKKSELTYISPFENIWYTFYEYINC